MQEDAQSGEALPVIPAGKDEGLSPSSGREMRRRGHLDGGISYGQERVHLLWDGEKGKSRLHIAGIILSERFFLFIKRDQFSFHACT